MRPFIACFAIFLAIQSSLNVAALNEAEISKFQDDFNNYLWRGLKSDDLEKYMDMFAKKFSPDVKFGVDCSLCENGARALINYVRLGGSTDLIRQIAIEVCEKIPWPEDVCAGAIDLNMPIFISIIRSKNPRINAKDLCKIVEQPECIGHFTPTPWEIDLHLNDSIKPQTIAKPSGKEPLKIAHIADIHYDPEYKEGMNGACGKPCCCREVDGSSPDPTKNGGYWGTYLTCEVPLRVVEKAVEEIKKQNVVALYYTGDTTAHNVWSTTSDQIKSQINEVFNIYATNLPNASIFGALGNHEGQPVNEWPPASVADQGFTMQWLYDDIATIWSPWLSEEAIEQVKYAGYYTTKMTDSLRIVALNNNFCITENWWLMLGTVDPFEQLQWLSDTLYQAELDGEFVHLLYHVPPGDHGTEIVCQQQFRKIVLRYSHLIKGQFLGHSHHDTLYNFYDYENKSLALATAFNGGGLTTYQALNPNFRILHVDPDTYDILDYDQYIFNMTEANLNGENPPVWYKLYTFTEFFGVDSAMPVDVDKAIIKMAQNDSLTRDYLRMSTKNSDWYDPNSCSTDDCIDSTLCVYVTTDFTDQSDCDHIKSIRHGNTV